MIHIILVHHILQTHPNSFARIFPIPLLPSRKYLRALALDEIVGEDDIAAVPLPPLVGSIATTHFCSSARPPRASHQLPNFSLPVVTTNHRRFSVPGKTTHVINLSKIVVEASTIDKFSVCIFGYAPLCNCDSCLSWPANNIFNIDLFD